MDYRKLPAISNNDLEKFFLENKGKVIHKWWHYFEIYEKHFSKFRNKKPRILEIGVQGGGSLCLWKNYFGQDSTIYGIDINPSCKSLEEENINIIIGSQGDLHFLNKIREEIGQVDIIIDDGSHIFHHQILSLETLYPMLKEGGIYLCEDTHTSYYKDYGGFVKNPSSFMEYAKDITDKLNFNHNNIERDYIALNTFSATFYDSIVILEKRKVVEPWHYRTGFTDGF